MAATASWNRSRRSSWDVSKWVRCRQVHRFAPGVSGGHSHRSWRSQYPSGLVNHKEGSLGPKVSALLDMINDEMLHNEFVNWSSVAISTDNIIKMNNCPNSGVPCFSNLGLATLQAFFHWSQKKSCKCWTVEMYFLQVGEKAEKNKPGFHAQ